MPFPPTDRVSYKHSPVRHVICQLRFPAILRIETSLPADFQDRIRHIFPLFQEKQEQSIPQFPQNLQEVIPSELRGLFKKNPAYEFSSADGAWTVSLTREFMALSTSAYKRWEDFQSHLYEPLEALKEIYRPAYFSRIGLRYQNVIVRSEIGLASVKWSDLIDPSVAGLPTNKTVEESVQSSQQIVIISLIDNTGQVRIIHGLAEVEMNGKSENGYSIDNDFFTEKEIGVGDETELLANFNRKAGQLFRWCITSKLHAAMGPEAISRNEHRGE